MKARARRTDPLSSHLAAKEIERTAAATHREIILNFVLSHPWFTCDEITEQINLDRHQISKRLTDLRHSGLVANGDQRLCKVKRRLMLTWGPPKPLGQTTLF